MPKLLGILDISVWAPTCRDAGFRIAQRSFGFFVWGVIMFQRLIGLIGEKQYNKLRNSHILVIGCGGVGGYAIECLARCGIGSITLVDFDIVDISNINRQIIALNSSVGKYKVDLFKERILDINPDCNVEIIKHKVTLDNVNDLFNNTYDFVIDAIDDIKTKCEIIKICTEKKIKFIVSLGTSKRINPSDLEITTLDSTSYDPIARKLRKFVKDNGIKDKITVLFSKEMPISCGGDDSTIYSSIFVPSTAGILIANYVFEKLIN